MPRVISLTLFIANPGLEEEEVEGLTVGEGTVGPYMGVLVGEGDSTETNPLPIGDSPVTELGGGGRVCPGMTAGMLGALLLIEAASTEGISEPPPQPLTKRTQATPTILAFMAIFDILCFAPSLEGYRQNKYFKRKTILRDVPKRNFPQEKVATSITRRMKHLEEETFFDETKSVNNSPPITMKEDSYN